MGVRTVEWGEYVSGHTWGRATSASNSTRQHLVPYVEGDPYATTALCGKGTDTAEFVSGTLCPACAKIAAEQNLEWHVLVDEGLWSWSQYGHGPDFAAYLDEITCAAHIDRSELALLASAGQRYGYPWAAAVTEAYEKLGGDPLVALDPPEAEPPTPPPPPSPPPVTDAMIVATIPERELVHRRVMAEIEATGLLAAKWDADLASPARYNEVAEWSWRRGSGWLHIAAPGSTFNRDLDKGFRVDAAFGGSETRRGTSIDGVYGPTPTEALVAAIESLGAAS